MYLNTVTLTHTMYNGDAFSAASSLKELISKIIARVIFHYQS